MAKVEDGLAQLLWSHARAVNNPAFIDADPVQFARRFNDLRDIEIAALLASCIAWGNRRMICRNAARMFDLMDNQPYRFVAEGEYENIADQNIHRTFFASNLRHYLRGLHCIYKKYGTLERFAAARGIAGRECAPWHLARAINGVLADANGGKTDSRCMPQNLETTALKRLNMALRWLVRNDGIVDLGVWTALKPSQLYIPLDVHVANVSRGLGLLERKSNDRKAVESLTAVLRTLNPEDPALFDYALFGIGIAMKNKDTVLTETAVCQAIAGR